MKRQPKRLKQLIIALGVTLPLLLFLAGYLVIHLANYYLHCIGVVDDPGLDGHHPVEEVTEHTGGFVMRRYRIEAHWLDYFIAGDPHQRSDDGHDSVVVISDLRDGVIFKFRHWDSDLKLTVSPAGVTSLDGINWKAP